jgi:hypothetical protein
MDFRARFRLGKAVVNCLTSNGKKAIVGAPLESLDYSPGTSVVANKGPNLRSGRHNLISTEMIPSGCFTPLTSIADLVYSIVQIPVRDQVYCAARESDHLDTSENMNVMSPISSPIPTPCECFRL